MISTISDLPAVVDKVLEPEIVEPQETLGVTLQIRAKHTGLLKAARKAGSQRKLAELLGVNEQTLGRWLNLGNLPSFLGDVVREAEVDAVLFPLIGQTVEDLWPSPIRKIPFKSAQQVEVDLQLGVNDIGSCAADRLITSDPHDDAIKSEHATILSKALETLSYREKEIIRMRCGLGGDIPMTLEEVGHVFKVTPTRIRAIQAKGMYKLGDYLRNNYKNDFCEEKPTCV